jgi:hypothetical protein
MLAFAVFLTSSDEALLNSGEKLLCSSVPMKVSHSWYGSYMRPNDYARASPAC